MSLSRASLVLAAVLACAGPGCAHRAPLDHSQLGRVIVYRNGVAYFERRATVDGEFSIEVPRRRVDDFLKSLTVIDLKDETPLSVSYETPRESSERSVTMRIELPPGERNVLITYVTESPAWKPSYRVILQDDGRATLQSLAVVDNVSNEPWEDVRVGVGTTSALSFRYDLHSVRMVKRQTLEGQDPHAAAPPRGGSAYAVEGDEQRVLAVLSPADLGPTRARAGQSIVQEFVEEVEYSEIPAVPITSASAESRYVVHGADVMDPSDLRVSPPPPPEPEDEPEPYPVHRLAKQLRHTSASLRIEGHRLASESPESDAALRRANALREQLVVLGVRRSRIDVTRGTKVVRDPSHAIEVLAVDEAKLRQAVHEQGDDAPRGSALFMAQDPLSLRVGHSAMVTLLEAQTQAERVYLFDPTSERGSDTFAFNAVRIANPTDHTLDSGPVTVYAQDQYLGEGLAEPIPPQANAFVPYALDRTIRVQTKTETRDELESLVHVRSGVATTDVTRVNTTTFSLHNRGSSAAVVHVRHTVPAGWSARDQPADSERYGDDLLVPVSVPAGAQVSLTLAESMPLQTTLNLQETADLVMIKRYLASSRAAKSVATDLQRLVDAHGTRRSLLAALQTQRDTIAALRGRTRELREQLVALRKTKQARALSSHLAKQMRSVSDELDQALARAAALETQSLEAQIELSAVVADLAVPASLSSPDSTG